MLFPSSNFISVSSSPQINHFKTSHGKLERFIVVDAQVTEWIPCCRSLSSKGVTECNEALNDNYSRVYLGNGICSVFLFLTYTCSVCNLQWKDLNQIGEGALGHNGEL